MHTTARIEIPINFSCDDFKFQVMLPEVMPAQFQATYTPIAAAGTPIQIKHMARLLAAQLVAAGFGKSVEQSSESEKKPVRKTFCCSAWRFIPTC